MAKLSLALLGPFEASLDGEPISGLTSAKARALLAYLAVESERAHLRGELAELLWPDQTREAALSSLRQALVQLRRALGDQEVASPVILATRDSLQFSRTSDHWCDVIAFRALVATDGSGGATLEALEQAMDLYRGEFLAGFPAVYSSDFEDWAAFQRADLSRQALLALQRIAWAAEAEGDLARAEALARHQLAIEPWREEAHRQLMRVLTLSDQRSAALAQYEGCRRALREGLDVEPDRETVALYERIREGDYERAVPTVQPVSPGQRSADTGKPAFAPSASGLFVGRERELAWLDQHLSLAAEGQGRVVFVTGEAGSGKTALLAEFARRAVEKHGDLVVALGGATAQTGIGDPYLSFREALQMLTGDVEAKRAGESIVPEQARRIWALLPQVIEALAELGPDLLGLLVPGEALLARLQALGPAGPGMASLEALLQRQRTRQPAALPQTDLFEQATRFLGHLARQQTLMLVLDDLQWADQGTASLLFHLGRRVAGQRILVVGAFRPEEVAMGRGGERHPLEPVVNEMMRDFGGVLLDLDDAEGRLFVDQLLDAEPNLLGEGFRQSLHRRTGGQALFTVELLRGMAERGDLVRDDTGVWVQGPGLDWERLPARVEAVIAERVGRLPRELQDLLEVASVEGETFIAEVVARALGKDAREVIRLLSGPLAREHQLVTARSLQRVGGQRLSGYSFRHSLFQQYMYDRLDEVERARLHETVGIALEALHGSSSTAVAGQLAWHFEAAGLPEKAAGYLQQAGDEAMRLAAWEMARERFERGLELLATLPDTPQRGRQEVHLQLALGSALFATEGMGSRRRLEAYTTAYDLSRRVGAQVDLWPALHALASSATSRADYPRALELGEQLLELAQRSGEAWLRGLAHFSLGATLFSEGSSLVRARDHLEQALRFCDEESDAERCRFLISISTFDVGVNSRAWLSTVLWMVGCPDQALRRSEEALASARQMGHLLSLVLALYAACQARHHRGDNQGLRQRVEQLRELISGKRLLVGDVWVEVFGGRLLVHEGRVEEGLKRIREGVEAWARTGAIFGATAQLVVLADACLAAGEVEEGLGAVSRGLALVERTGARPNEAGLHHLGGELLLARGKEGDVPEAETYFRRALEVARSQGARGWELRAATGMARLWAGQGRRQEARELLAPVYQWFTEGFDTADLLEAKAVLDGLA